MEKLISTSIIHFAIDIVLHQGLTISMDAKNQIFTEMLNFLNRDLADISKSKHFLQVNNAKSLFGLTELYPNTCKQEYSHSGIFTINRNY